jgi:hypothetical protein
MSALVLRDVRHWNGVGADVNAFGVARPGSGGGFNGWDSKPVALMVDFSFSGFGGGVCGAMREEGGRRRPTDVGWLGA